MQQQQQHTGGDGGDGLRPHNRVRQKSVEECGEATGLNGTRANVCESKALAHTQRERERERGALTAFHRPTAASRRLSTPIPSPF
jgi:hypothetical protein